MGERDAFGREKGEDMLGELGWSSASDSAAATPATPATPEDAAAPVTPEPSSTAAPTPPPVISAGPAWTPVPPAIVRRRHRRRAPGIVTPLVLIGFVALVIGGATTAMRTGRGAVDDFQSAVPAETPAGLESGSLLRPAALKTALAKLPSREIQTLRVAPERIDAQVYVGGRMHVVQVRSDGGVSDVATRVGGSVKRLRLDASAPNRIVRTAAKRAGRGPSRVLYLVLLGNEWQLFFDDGLRYSASANGRKVKRVG
jgi:hypothetical protein